MKILPWFDNFDGNQKRRHKDYIGLYVGLVVFTATGAKVKNQPKIKNLFSLNTYMQKSIHFSVYI